MKLPSLLRLLLTVSALALALAVWPGCATDTSTEAQAKVLRVGVTPNYPPIIFKEGGQIAGVEAEFARKLAHRLGEQVKFVEMPFDQLLPALDAGRIDIIMSGMTVTDVRTPLAQFCEPYATTGQALLVRAPDLWTYSYPQVIFAIKTRIGVEKGTIADLLAKRRCPKATIVTFPSPEAAVEALKAKRVDVVMADAPVIWRLAADKAGLVPVSRLLTQESLAWAVRRGDTNLLNAANAALQKWHADGTQARIIQSYFPLHQ